MATAPRLPDLFTREWEVVIPDSSALIALAAAGREALELIAAVHGPIRIPDVVVDECVHRQDRAEAVAIEGWLRAHGSRIDTAPTKEMPILRAMRERGEGGGQGLGDNAIAAFVLDSAVADRKAGRETELLALVNDIQLFERIRAVDRQSTIMTATALVEEAQAAGKTVAAEGILREMREASRRPLRKAVVVSRRTKEASRRTSGRGDAR